MGTKYVKFDCWLAPAEGGRTRFVRAVDESGRRLSKKVVDYILGSDFWEGERHGWPGCVTKALDGVDEQGDVWDFDGDLIKLTAYYWRDEGLGRERYTSTKVVEGGEG